MSKIKYEIVANRKDHSDTLYYNILGICLIVNSAFGAGAGAIIRDMQDYRDCGLLVILSVSGWVLTWNFNKYLRNEKRYQKYLRDYFDRRSVEFNEYPDLFERPKEIKEDTLQSSWSNITRIIATFWSMVFFFGIGVAVSIYNG